MKSINFKALSLGSLAALTLAAAPLAIANASYAGEGDRRGHRLEQLDLTEAQSAQLQAIRTDSRAQVQAVLTAEQQATVENSESPREAWRSLDLSDDQRSQIRTIRESAREQLRAVLTEEQRTQLQEMRPERRGR